VLRVGVPRAAIDFNLVNNVVWAAPRMLGPATTVMAGPVVNGSAWVVGVRF
jgi:hypothetical protein